MGRKPCKRCRVSSSQRKGLCKRCMTMEERREWGLLCIQCDNWRVRGGYCNRCARDSGRLDLLCRLCQKRAPVSGGWCTRCQPPELKEKRKSKCVKCGMKQRDGRVGSQHPDWGHCCRSCMSAGELNAVREYVRTQMSSMCSKCGIKKRDTQVGGRLPSWGKSCRDCMGEAELAAVREYENGRKA